MKLLRTLQSKKCYYIQTANLTDSGIVKRRLWCQYARRILGWKCLVWSNFQRFPLSICIVSTWDANCSIGAVTLLGQSCTNAYIRLSWFRCRTDIRLFDKYPILSYTLCKWNLFRLTSCSHFAKKLALFQNIFLHFCYCLSTLSYFLTFFKRCGDFYLTYMVNMNQWMS